MNIVIQTANWAVKVEPRSTPGRFRGDLLARVKLWTFLLPSLKNRLEDIEPNLAYELERFSREEGSRVRFTTEAREAFLAFATSAEAA